MDVYSVKLNCCESGRKRSKGQLVHESLKEVLVMSQLFGLLPVRGITQSDPKKLSFTWKAKRVCYTLVLGTLALFVALMAIVHLVFTGVHIRNCSVMIFYTNGLLINVLFLKMATRWPSLMNMWYDMENSVKCHPQGTNIKKQIRTITTVVMVATAIEHCLSLNKAVQYVINHLDNEEPFKDMMLIFFEFVYSYVPYSLVMSIVLFGVNFVTQFSWNFMDLFIMLISVALSKKFETVTFRIQSASLKQKSSVLFWRSIREDYNELIAVFGKLEEEMSVLVFISFSSNLLFILMQLFQSLHQRVSGWENFYFFSSFVLLLLRTIGVTLYAAKVNDASRKPLHFLNDVPNRVYSLEVERFVLQLHLDAVVLTGCNLFKVTRSLLCSMAGTVVTYELLLFQFNVSITI